MSRRLRLLLATGLAVAAAVLVWVTAGDSQTNPVAVYPTAGTPTASPRTQVSFRGAAPGALGTVTVSGSKTGQHTGKLVAHSDGQGASFLPDKPFAPGEQVTVTAGATLAGATNGSVRFSIFTPPARRAKLQFLKDPGGHPRGPQRFRSRRTLQPPVLKVLKSSGAVAPGSIFVAPKAGAGQDGPAIYDGAGNLVWFHPMPRHTSALDFRTQQLNGKPVLTWWQGKVYFPGLGFGVGMIYDNSYRPLKVVKAGNGYSVDLHEFELTPQGTALVLAYQPVGWNLRPVHGPSRGLAIDNVVQEIDVSTGLVMREWHSLGQVDIRESYMPLTPKAPDDYIHLNSVQVESNGNWLISGRNTHALYEVDPASGAILDRIGGKNSSFKLGHGVQSLSQHDAREESDGTITLFDNGQPPSPGRASRAEAIAIDRNAKTVRLVRSIRHRPSTKTISQGSVQRLPNGDTFVGWGGAVPFVSEYSPSGRLVFDARFSPSGDDSYRAFKLPWTAQPAAPPDVAARKAGGKTIVYASWNGATNVSSWQVLAGASVSSLQPAGSKPRRGFETAIHVTGTPAFVAVRALGAGGAVLGTSRTVSPR